MLLSPSPSFMVFLGCLFVLQPWFGQWEEEGKKNTDVDDADVFCLTDTHSPEE